MKRSAAILLISTSLLLTGCAAEVRGESTSGSPASPSSTAKTPVASSSAPAVKLTAYESCEAMAGGGDESLAVRTAQNSYDLDIVPALSQEIYDDASSLVDELTALEDQVPESHKDLLSNLRENPLSIYDAIHDDEDQFTFSPDGAYMAARAVAEECLVGEELDSVIASIEAMEEPGDEKGAEPEATEAAEPAVEDLSELDDGTMGDLGVLVSVWQDASGEHCDGSNQNHILNAEESIRCGEVQLAVYKDQDDLNILLAAASATIEELDGSSTWLVGEDWSVNADRATQELMQKVVGGKFVDLPLQ